MEESSLSLVNSYSMQAIGKRSLWMGSLDSSIDEVVITAAFEKMGERPQRVKFIRDKVTGLPNTSFCFVQFKDQEAAESTMKRINGKPIPNAPHLKFNLAPTRSGSERESPHQRKSEFSLFVGNLTEDVTESELLHFFSSRYSTVKEATLCKSPDGLSKGFGFVRFYNERDHLEALRRMDGVRGLGSRTIYVKLATPRPRGRYTETSDRQEEHQDTYGYYGQQQQTNQYPTQTHSSNNNNPYYGSDAWSGQYQQYQSQYPQPYQYPSQLNESPSLTNTQQQIENPSGKEEKDAEKDESEELADQELHLNVDLMNEDFIRNNEELYSSLEKSRWHFVDSVTTTIDEICMT
ncbi:tRNA selenocysteine 1-associated protein 1-like isoform X2 [Apostichopus japonicus]|uniref:tRNA selenocysteine 1-associated protein 1-like isoform X2 n=1 Tax=Stichopus japonicus TaxID=307972 RepID=UPI003AB6A18D